MRYKYMTEALFSGQPKGPPEGSVKMLDAEGREYWQHPDKVAKRLTQGWVLADPAAEPEKIETPVVKRVSKKKSRK